MRELTVRIEERTAGATVVALAGEAGMAAADRLHFELTRLSALRPRLTVLDVSGVTLISSLAMGALLAFAGGMKVNGCRVVLAGATGNVGDSLRRACLDRVIPMVGTVEQAVG
jgi:anti-anti-sigma factor